MKRFSLGLLFLMVSAVALAGCSVDEQTSESAESSSEQVSTSSESSDAESDKVEADVTESSSDVSSDSESESTESSDSTMASTSNAEVSGTNEQSKSDTAPTTATSASTVHPAQTTGQSSQAVPNNKVSTAGDTRVWGDQHTMRYYTPAQNYRGFRPRHAVPFDSESAAQAAGYQKSTRRAR
ncbi:hypothetical protein RA086_01700 [Lactiplantibacillus sp. WILCCON 0030]|uniref:Uncharacterized protein n=1 Tax=Lactiplantibacillus brownii TaxID=3069269 RepID=A0ABU1A7D1_9LACO|nr:hypothetical protein [Lactiplantibacillus brownii]MDQ7936367.1 hypothetical protein [Lactiplantibacillus brownii]